MVKLLLKHEANPNTKTENPCKSPIQLAAAGGYVEIMDELVKHDFDWRHRDEWGWTLLHEVRRV